MCPNDILLRAIPEKNTWGGKKALFFLPHHPWNLISTDPYHPYNQKGSYAHHP